MTCACRARPHTSWNLIFHFQRLVINPVNTERALLHHAFSRIHLTCAIRARPCTKPAANAPIFIDQHNAIFFTLIRCSCRANRHTRCIFTMQARFREMHNPCICACAGLECMHAVKPRAHRIIAIGIFISQRRAITGRVPFFTIHHTSLTADTNIKVDHKAKFHI